MDKQIRVTVWNEYRHEKNEPSIGEIYPEGIHGAIAGFLKKETDLVVTTATLDQPANGLPDSLLDSTDVLIWWGHMAHDEVPDALARRIQDRVLHGMGLVVLHSGHFSKPFKLLMGTTCLLRWRDVGEKERLWVVEPAHPIADGLGPWIELPREEMYGERFDIPDPDTTVLVSWFAGGNVCRSGCCFSRGEGRIFYFRPGHESYPTYHQAEIQRVISNAVHWARPGRCPSVKLGESEDPLEKL
jgi:trehalose utilization protein